MTHTMADAVDPSALRRYSTDAVAGYVNGRWATIGAARALGKPTLSIAVSAGADAQCLDVEPGDATPAQAAAWVDRQHARGVSLPWVYTARGDAARVKAALGSRQYVLWIAHPDGGGAHICTAARCGVDADATQHTWRADVDLTTMNDRAWASIGGSVGHASNSAAPTAASATPSIKTVQGELRRLFPAYAGTLVVDGINGPATKAAVAEFQRRAGLTPDSVVGPLTLAALRRFGARL